MNKKTKVILFTIFFLAASIISVISINWYFINKENKLTEKYCGEDPAGIECYSFRYRKLLPHFIMYNATANKKPLKFFKLGWIESTVYIVPYHALEKSEALIGYGILDDISFEERYSKLFNKPSYAFDCGTESISINEPKCTFQSECIGTDEYVLPQLTSSKKIHSFSKKLKELGLENKPIYIKMDIAGAEPFVIDEILKHSKNITGISIVVHCDESSQIPLVVEMLKKFDKDFVLVIRQTHYLHQKLHPVYMHLPNTKKQFGRAMSLTYINKNIIDSYHIRLNQNSSSLKWDGNQEYLTESDILLYKYIPYLIKKEFEYGKK